MGNCSIRTEAIQDLNDRELARLISRVEAGDPSVQPCLPTFYRASGRARVIGISGPPGAGKSTLVDKLIAHYRAQGHRVAIMAIDPSSPFSGGAVLGDRVRMARHSADRGVFIRSLAARGALGGLTAATADVLSLLDASGWDIILLETVGVGQNEVEIMRVAPTVVIVQNPGDGDAVQSVKSGTLEIAHIFAVNKADMDGAEKVARDLDEMLGHKARRTSQGWKEPVVLTEANTGKGVDELAAAIDARFEFLQTHSDIARAEERDRLRARIANLAAHELKRRIAALDAAAGGLSDILDNLQDRTTDPHSVAAEFLAGVATRGSDRPFGEDAHSSSASDNRLPRSVEAVAKGH